MEIPDTIHKRNPAPRWPGISVGLFSLFASLVLVEIAVRILKLDHAHAVHYDRPKTYFLPESSHSGRDVAYSTEKPAGTFRIAVVGDSFTFGPYLQFDDTFPKRLERMLNLNVGASKVEVMNLGVEGYSTVQEVEAVKTALRIHPDLIVLQITLNDPEIEPYSPGEHRREAAERHAQWLEEWWHTLKFVRTRLSNRHSRKWYVEYHTELFENPETWGRFRGGCTMIRDISARANVPLVAVLFPMFAFPFDANYPFTRLHEKVKSVYQALGVPFLDLFDRFQDLTPERLEIMPGKDSHPNEIAHRIAAEGIYKFLLHNHFVPESVAAKVTTHHRASLPIRAPQ